MQVTHPKKICVPVEQALREWRGAGHFEIKLDGAFTVLPVSDGILLGETVGNRFTCFDVAQFGESDARIFPLAQRLAWRGELCRRHGLPEVDAFESNGADLLDRVLSAGGEGVVLKSPGDYWQPMLAAKRSIIVTVRVTGFCGGTQSVQIADAATGQPRGKVALRGGKCEQVRIGSLVRVEGMNLTDDGKIRQPNPTRQWLVQY